MKVTIEIPDNYSDLSSEEVHRLVQHHVDQKEAPAESELIPPDRLDFIQELVDLLPNFVFVKDTKRRFVIVNQAIVQAVGAASPQDLIGKTDHDLFPKAIADTFEHDDQIVMRTGRPLLNQEETIVDRGFKRWVSTNKVPWYNSEGKIIGVLGISTDITELESAHLEILRLNHELEKRVRDRTKAWKDKIKALRIEKSILRAVINNIPDMIVVKNTRHEIVMGNHASATVGRVLSPESVAIDEEQHVMRTLTPVISQEESFKFGDSEVCFSTSRLPWIDESGKLLGVISISKDITETRVHKKQVDQLHKELEGQNREKTLDLKLKINELSQEKRLMSGIINSVPDLIYVKNRNHQFVTANKGTLRSFALEIPEDIIGKTDFDFHEHDRAEQFLQDELKIFETGQAMVAHEECLVLLGKERWHSSTKVPWMDDKGDIIGLIGIGRDITKRKKVEKRLQEAKEEAEAASHTKTQFLANISHEIRSPLNAIIGFSEILLEKNKNSGLPEEFFTFLENIHMSGENLAKMINNVLDFSKIEAGKIEVNEENFEIRELLKNVFDLYDTQAQKKGIQFSFEIASELPDFIFCDWGKVFQILINLVGNAIKFTPSGQLVTLKAFQEEDNIKFMVIDHGIGIPQEQMGVIFEAFSQGDSSLNRQFGGTGLGLSITKKMVELLNGKIQVHCRKGITNFSVTLPLKLGDQTEQTRKYYTSQDTAFLKNRKILVADDIQMNQALIESWLRDWGAEVHLAINGKQAIEKVMQNPPDLVLMDIQMPGVDGFEATQLIQLHPEFKDIPIIGLSADAFTSQQEKALKSGMHGYLTKPLNIEKLFTLLQKFLG